MVFIMMMKTKTSSIPLKNGLHHDDEAKTNPIPLTKGLHHGDEDQNQLYSTQRWSSS
jgi:hypothetical protein